MGNKRVMLLYPKMMRQHAVWLCMVMERLDLIQLQPMQPNLVFTMLKPLKIRRFGLHSLLKSCLAKPTGLVLGVFFNLCTHGFSGYRSIDSSDFGLVI
jgi:hypothetical protein